MTNYCFIVTILLLYLLCSPDTLMFLLFHTDFFSSLRISLGSVKVFTTTSAADSRSTHQTSQTVSICACNISS